MPDDQLQPEEDEATAVPQADAEPDGNPEEAEPRVPDAPEEPEVQAPEQPEAEIEVPEQPEAEQEVPDQPEPGIEAPDVPVEAPGPLGETEVAPPAELVDMALGGLSDDDLSVPMPGGDDLEPAPEPAAVFTAGDVEVQQYPDGGLVIGTSDEHDQSGLLPPHVERVWIRNDTGIGRQRFDVLGIGDVVTQPDSAMTGLFFTGDVAFSGVAPSTGYAGRFAVLQEPIAAGAIGSAVVAGPTVAYLNVSAQTDTCAEVYASPSGLGTGPTGSARILWKPSGTGFKWGVVSLGDGQAAPAAVVGYGKPATGQADAPIAADITLTITDEAGTPILDDEGAQQTIKVWRNATASSLWTDFVDDTIFSYVVFAEPESTGHGGCIFSRTEGFRYNELYMPIDGHALYGTEEPPAGTDAAGDPGDENSIFVRGWMYVDENELGRSWRPWFVIDPSLVAGPCDLLDGEVHTDTVAHTAAAGDIIFATGGETPQWDGLPAGAAGTILACVGTPAMPTWIGTDGTWLSVTLVESTYYLSHVGPSTTQTTITIEGDNGLTGTGTITLDETGHCNNETGSITISHDDPGATAVTLTIHGNDGLTGTGDLTFDTYGHSNIGSGTLTISHDSAGAASQSITIEGDDWLTTDGSAGFDIHGHYAGGADLSIVHANPEAHVPAGGDEDQVLAKASGDDYDTQWQTVCTVPPGVNVDDMLKWSGTAWILLDFSTASTNYVVTKLPSGSLGWGPVRAI